MFALLASSVMRTPYLNDDLLNQATRDWTWPYLFEFSWKIISEWATTQGRFFPGNVFWAYGLFRITTDLVSYKLVLIAIIGSLVVLTWLLVYKIFRSVSASHLSTLSLLALLQLRVNWDALTSFSGIVPLVISLWLAAVLLFTSNRRWAWFCGSVILYFALVTYETIVLFTPLIALLIVSMRIPLRRLYFALVPVAIQLITVGLLRANLATESIAPGYKISLVPNEIAITFLKQLVSILPQSEWWLGGISVAANLPAIPKVLYLAVGILVGIPVLLGAPWLILKASESVTYRGASYTFLAGVWILASTALAPALTLRWQDELSWGFGYINTVFEYFGAAFVLTGLVLLAQVIARKNRMRRIIASQLGAGLMAIIAILTVSNNLWISALIG